MAQMVKDLPAVQETQVPFLGQNNPLEKEMAIHSSIPAWRIPWTEESGRLQSRRLLRAGYDWVTNTLFPLKKVCKNEYKGLIFSIVKFYTLIIIKFGWDILFKVSLFLCLPSQIYFLFGKNLKYQLKIIDFLKFTVKANNDVLGFSSGLCFRNEYATCVYICVYIC